MTVPGNGAILLLNPPFRQKVIRSYYCCFSSKADYLWPPIDLLVQSGVLSDRYRVEVIDAVAEGLSEQDVLNRTRDKHYRAILSLTGTYTWRDDFPLLETLVRETQSPLFVSGNITLFRPEFFLEQYPFLTGILHNFTSNDLLNYLDGQGSLQALSYRKSGNQGFNLGERNIHPGQPIRYPAPRHELFPLKNYSTPLAKRLPMTVLLTSFGCPFHCTFCVSSTLEFCQRPIEEVIQEMKQIQSAGIREVFIEDNTFTADKKYVHLLCQRIIEEKIQLSWTCNVHAATVDKVILYPITRTWT